MSFYSRKIPHYKSFRVIDTDGDGIRDTLAYQPYSNFYHIQFGMEQTIKNIGHYNLGVNDDFEVVSFDGIWDESNDGSGDNNPETPPPLGGITGDTSGTNTQIDPGEFCNDPEASNYNPSLVGNPNYFPCPDNRCCEYTEPGDYTQGSHSGGIDGNTDLLNLECLPLYTDWGPWNDNLLLNDTSQIYNTNTDCVLTLRMINQNADLGTSSTLFNNLVVGGWYGASIKIEIDNGLGFETISPGNPLVLDMDTTNSGYSDIEYDTIKETFTLGEKIKMWMVEQPGGLNESKYCTRPYRDITIKASSNSTIKVTYYNGPSSIGNALYKNLRLQLIKGTKFTPTPFDPASNIPITANTSSNTWQWDDTFWLTPTMSSFLGSISDRYNEGETL